MDDAGKNNNSYNNCVVIMVAVMAAAELNAMVIVTTLMHVRDVVIKKRVQNVWTFEHIETCPNIMLQFKPDNFFNHMCCLVT